mgnify:CR=1 FL=1
MIGRKEVLNYYKSEMSVKDAVKQFGFKDRDSFYKELTRFQISVIYDDATLSDEIYSLSQRVSKVQFIKEMGMSAAKVNRLPHGTVLKTGSLIRLLSYFDVRFVVDVYEVKEYGTFTVSLYELKVPIDLNRWLRKEGKPEVKFDGKMQDRYNISFNLEMISLYKKSLEDLFERKKISAETKNEVLDKFNSAIKEALMIGVKAQKENKGDAIELAIAKEFMKGCD